MPYTAHAREPVTNRKLSVLIAGDLVPANDRLRYTKIIYKGNEAKRVTHAVYADVTLGDVTVPVLKLP